MKNQELVFLHDSTTWSKILKILKSYAEMIFKVKNLSIIVGKAPDDYVYEARKLFFEGKRKWNRVLCPDLTDFLKSIIKSLISNDLRSKGFKTKSDNSIEFYSEIVKSQESDNPEGPLNKLDLKTLIMKEIEDDEIASIVLEYVEDCSKPSELASVLGLEVYEVYKALKRLRRATTKVLNKEKSN